MKINNIVKMSRTSMSGIANPIATGNDAIFAARVSHPAIISPAPMSVEPRYPTSRQTCKWKSRRYNGIHTSCENCRGMTSFYTCAPSSIGVN